MNKKAVIKYRDVSMEIQYDRSSSEPLKYQSQTDYSAFQDKEIMIKPLQLEYINIHKGTILIKNAFLSSI